MCDFCEYYTNGNMWNNYVNSQLTNEINSIVTKSLVRAANWRWHGSAVYVNVMLIHTAFNTKLFHFITVEVSKTTNNKFKVTYLISFTHKGGGGGLEGGSSHVKEASFKTCWAITRWQYSRLMLINRAQITCYGQLPYKCIYLNNMAAVIHITDMVNCYLLYWQSDATCKTYISWSLMVHVNAVIHDNPQLLLTSLSSMLNSGQASSSNISLINLLMLLVHNFCRNKRHQVSKLIMHCSFQHNKAVMSWFPTD